MKLIRVLLPTLYVVALLLGCEKKIGTLDPELTRFVTTKQLQAQQLAMTEGVDFPYPAEKIFTAILTDDLGAATNLFLRLEIFSDNSSMVSQANDWARERLESVGVLKPKILGSGALWEPVREACWTYALSKTWQKPRLDTIVREITSTIGTNSIYFGGTDVGRFAITAAMNSHEDGRPYFVLTQNFMAQGHYLTYLNSMFTNQIYIPTMDDLLRTFQDYLADVGRRQRSGELKINENVIVDTNGTPVAVNGHGAFWEVTGRMVKIVFDRNVDREIYIEQSVPLTWAYPHLVPAGPIFKLNRKPLRRLPDSVVEADRAYWSNFCGPLIGDWITNATTFDEICEFAARVYMRNELKGFKGDTSYIRDRIAQQYYSKLRISTADLYIWRCVQATDTTEKTQMWTEALLAMKQALALAPGSFDTATFIKNVLLDVKQYDDAIAIMRIGAALNPSNEHLQHEISRIQKLRTTLSF